MSRTRWQHLDRHKPAPRQEAPPAAASEPPAHPTPAPPPNEPAPAWLVAARAQYRMGAFTDCADALASLVPTHPEPPEARRLLGLSLAQLGEYDRAISLLRTALAEAPEDAPLRACVWSLELDRGILPIEAVLATPSPVPLQRMGETARTEPGTASSSLPSPWRRGAGGEAPETDPHLSTNELLEAARDWLHGQHLTRARRQSEAARAFGDAAQKFARLSPPAVLPERLAACYVGQGIAYLLAGQPEAAQTCYGRLPDSARAAAAGSPLSRFAAELYELAEAIRELPPPERAEAVAPLAELLASVRMRVRFLDPDRPPEIGLRWDCRG